MMSQLRWFAAAAVGAAALSASEPARACGGCFHEPSVTIQQQQNATQVTGHRMVLSLSQKQTTLYDQIEYVGDPKSFAWVLPIKGTVTVGLSSDLVFATLDQQTGVTVDSPTITCAPSSCPGQYPGLSAGYTAGYSAAATGSATSGPPPVQVLVQQTVGPYETVQLSSSDPKALDTWLSDHGYVVPADVEPIIAAYVAEGSNFLAMKLVPGAGVKAMRPVRVTMPGASTTLPLRMVAAGTGDTTTITLWVVAEGRYQPKNAPWFVIGPADLVWNWDTQSSNYADVRAKRYAASGGLAWQIETAQPYGLAGIQGQILQQANDDPGESGYDVDKAAAQASDDMAALFGGIDPSSAWVTRMRGELSRKAFAKDLTLEAAADQSWLQGSVSVDSTIGTAPTCPPTPGCGDTSGAGGSGARGLAAAGGGCSTRGDAPLADAWLAALGLGISLRRLVLARRRR